MKKLTLLAIICSLLLCGCTVKDPQSTKPQATPLSSENTPDSSNPVEEEKNEKLLLKGKEYLICNSDSTVGSVEIFLFEGKSAAAIKNLQTEIIFRFFPKQGYDNITLKNSKTDVDKTKDYSELGFDLDCRLALMSEDIISIVYSGNLTMKGSAHPSNLFLTLNFDPKTCELISVADRYHTDSRMYDVIMDNAEPYLKKAWGDSWKEIDPEWAFCSREDFESTLEGGSDINAYFTEDGIGFCFSVPSALGSHVEIELKEELIEHLKK